MRDADEIRIEVSDDSAKEPEIRHPNFAESHGRGLQIVQLVSREWGVEPNADGAGKTVWCTIGLAAEAAGHAYNS
jgi:hypothetical protein